MSETVRVEFDPPRKCRETDAAWCLSADGEPDVYLPKSETQLERDGEVVGAATMPGWLAENEGFLSTSSFQESGSQEEQTNDTMSRDDWFALGITMALVIRGDPALDALRAGTWNGKRLANRVRGIE